MVDLDARVVERWRRCDERPEVLSGTMRRAPDRGAAPFELDLPGYFDEVGNDGEGTPQFVPARTGNGAFPGHTT